MTCLAINASKLPSLQALTMRKQSKLNSVSIGVLVPGCIFPWYQPDLVVVDPTRSVRTFGVRTKFALYSAWPCQAFESGPVEVCRGRQKFE